jgi:receptor protein-tyrosine kinase
MLNRLGEERIAENLDHQQLSVTDSPTASSQPSNIHISLSIIAAVLCGGFCGILAPFVLELLGRRANSAAEVHAIIGRPVLGELPYVPALTVLGAHGDPNQPIMLTEAVRGLRTALRMRQAESDVGECLVIASCDGGDGKSTVAARLAMSMAQSGRKVLLVDGDLRRPSLHTQLGQTCEQGLSRLLAGEPGISPAETTYSNLSFLDAGDPTAQPGELLNSHCLLEWLNQCRKQFDDIVIDTPPLSMFADGLIIGGCADRILLVVREGATLKDSLVHVHELLAPLQDKLAGIAILNRPGTAQSVGIYRRQETLTVANPEAAATVGAGADMPQT